jgi:hypothetical protein
MPVVTPLIIYQDETRCIINYDHLMHIRRFVPSVAKFLMEIMPTAKIIYYNYIGLYREYLPDETDLPDIKFKYCSCFVTEEMVDLLKIVECDEPTIYIVEYN